MGSISFEGLDEFQEALKQISSMDQGKLIGEMVTAGAEETEKVWKEEITARGYINSHEMINRVEPDRKVKGNSSSSYKDVYPRGTVTRGNKKKIKTRNAEKAYILHYGRKNMLGSRFVDVIERKAADRAYEAEKKIYDKYIDEH